MRIPAAQALAPAAAPAVAAYDIMGRRLPDGGAVTVSLDPVDLVSPGARTTVPATGHPAPRPLSPAEHIVLSQRHAARDAAPGKDDGDAPPPYGYRLGRRTRMTVDVYDFGGSGRYVTVAAKGAKGGLVGSAGAATRAWVPAREGPAWTSWSCRGVRCVGGRTVG